MEIKTPRLLLRDFHPTDFDALLATMQDPAYQQFYAEEETTPQFWETLFAHLLEESGAADRRVYQLAICLPEGALIGTCGLRLKERENRQASFGCAIGRPYWGQGYAYEASRAILDYGFTHLPIHRVYAETNRENTRARQLAERLGMRLEGILQHHRYFRGRWWDTAIYAILQDEWQRQVG